MSVTKTGTGRVKMFAGTFAFVADDNGGEDIFVGRGVIEKSGIALAKGDAISYTAEPAPKGLRAVSISLAT
jgi:cold shock CspA family protein